MRPAKLAWLVAAVLFGQDNPYILRKADPKAPCTFAPEYKRIQGNKTDPRVAFIDLYPIVHAAEQTEFGFTALCKNVSQQTQDGIVVYDRAHAFLQLIWGEPVINDAVTRFSGQPGIVLYVSRTDDATWHNFVFQHGGGKWRDVTAEYLGPFNLQPADYVIAPQYGRTARVVSWDGEHFHHKLWLTWNGTKFKVEERDTAWRCPDAYGHFPSRDRAQYCH